jgi:hypothetical protein
MGSDIRTSDLNIKAVPVDTDLFMIVDVEDVTMAVSGTNKKSTFSDVAAAIAGILGLGPAAEKSVSAAGQAVVASVAAPVVAGHLAMFADGAGTVTDGGPIPPSVSVAPIHTVMAGPVTGAAALPVMRGLDPTDIPAIPESGVVNLVGDLAALNAGVAAAAVDTAVLHKASNLGDVSNPTAARGNLGLGTAATKAATGAGGAVASVVGPFVVGHVATYTDTLGTIGDGGAGFAAGMTQPIHAIMAGPVSGPAALPGFRGLDPTDIPAIPESGVTGLVGDLAALQAGVAAAAVDSAVLHKTANLADLANITTARGNLGLGTAAVKAVSGAGGVVASVSGPFVAGHVAVYADAAGTIGDGGALPGLPVAQPANAIYAGPTTGAAALPAFRVLVTADIPPIPESGVINLVNDLASLNTGLAAAAVDTAVLHKASNLADVSSVTAARGNLGLGSAALKAASGAGPGVASVTGTIAVGHVATFTDTAGTIGDGGALPAAAVAEAANTVYAGPTTGAAALPIFRPLVAADIPAIPAAGVTGLGTAALKAASGGGPAVASVSGPFTVGHVAVYTDAAGTIGDGGALPGAAVAEPANMVYAGPTSGAAALPAFRALVATDIPAIPAAGVTGLGTAALKAASGAGPAVASVAGTITAGHVAIFADGAGTVGDGGALPVAPVAEPANVVYAGPTTGAAALPGWRPLVVADIPAIPAANVTGLGTAALKAASGTTGVLASVFGTITAGHVVTFADGAGTIGDGGPLPAAPVAEPANVVYAGPASGAAALPAFRALVATDIPPIPAAGVTGLGTAATKAASMGAAAVVASVYGAVIAGHAPVFNDTNGTIIDGGFISLQTAGVAGSVQFNTSGGGLTAVPGVTTGGGALLNLSAQAVTDTPLAIHSVAGQTAALQSWGTVAAVTTIMDRYGRPAFSQVIKATVAAGPGAGTAPTLSITGNEIAGAVTLVAGTSPPASSLVFQVNYANPLGAVPCSIQIFAGNAFAATLPLNSMYLFVDWSTAGTANFRVFIAGTGALAAGTTYVFLYRVHL